MLTGEQTTTLESRTGFDNNRELITVAQGEDEKAAMAALEATGYYTEEELDGARKVLRAAAMTYVAALAVSLLQILRLVILSNNRRR
jgi:Zn-dependent membrane protease YugP